MPTAIAFPKGRWLSILVLLDALGGAGVYFLPVDSLPSALCGLILTVAVILAVRVAFVQI